MSENQEFSRPIKVTHAQTILYEIDMLRLAKERLISAAFSSDADRWIYLEAFLLHYRNLLEFFGGKPKKTSDLSISKPDQIWREQLPDQLKLAQLINDTFNQTWLDISRYLHHCTTYRILAKDWNIAEMFEQLRPFLEGFESLLPKYELNTPWRTSDSRQTSGTTSCSSFSKTYASSK